MKSKVIFFIISIVLLIAQVSCNVLLNEESIKSVGIFLPCSSPKRWLTEGKEMSAILEDKGYEVQLYYGNKNSAIQKNQIEEAMDKGLDAMIVAAVNPIDLVVTLDIASSNGVKIIAYDRLLINTESVSYFVAFDNTLIGVQQGTSLVEGLKAKGEGPYNIEIFAGCCLDGNAPYFYDGAMSVIQPLMDSGDINVVSKEILFNDVCTKEFSSNVAGERMERLLSTYYSDNTVLHGILSPSDSISIGLIETLDSKTCNYAHSYPIITGQDAEITNLIAITSLKQYSTIFKDSKLLSQIAASMVIAVLNNEIPEINDATSFHNGVKVVPTFLCEPVLITRGNYESDLIDTGYIKYDDIFPEK